MLTQARLKELLSYNKTTGVNWSKQANKWSASVMLRGNVTNLGYHKTALDAALARLTWELQCPEWNCNHRSELVKAIAASGMYLCF